LNSLDRFWGGISHENAGLLLQPPNTAMKSRIVKMKYFNGYQTTDPDFIPGKEVNWKLPKSASTTGTIMHVM